jgi:hypothetical protein
MCIVSNEIRTPDHPERSLVTKPTMSEINNSVLYWNSFSFKNQNSLLSVFLHMKSRRYVDKTN